MPRRDPRNVTRYWKDQAFAGLSLMRAEFTTHAFPPHVHEAFVVAVTDRGGSIVKSRGRIELARHEALLVFNPGEPHAGWMGRSSFWSYRSFYLSKPSMDRMAAELGVERLPHFTRNLFTDRDLIDDFLELHAAFAAGPRTHCHDALIAAFGTLLERHGSGGERIAASPNDRVLLCRAMDLVRQRYDRPLRVQDLASALQLTSFQIIGLFNRALGMTPHAYIIQVRLNMACRLLKRGYPIAEAATASGFYDQSALNRHFKRCFAITPLQFARANQPEPGHRYADQRRELQF